MKGIFIALMLVTLGAAPVDAYLVKKEAVEVEKSKHVNATPLPSTIILYDSEMKRKIVVESTEEMMTVTEGIQNAPSITEEWTEGEKLGTMDFGDEELLHIYYGKERNNVYLLGDEEIKVMSRKDFFSLFHPSFHSRPLPPGKGGDVQPLPPGRAVQPNDFLPL